MKQIKLLLSKAIKEFLELRFRQAIKSLATRQYFRGTVEKLPRESDWSLLITSFQLFDVLLTQQLTNYQPNSQDSGHWGIVVPSSYCLQEKTTNQPHKKHTQVPDTTSVLRRCKERSSGIIWIFNYNVISFFSNQYIMGKIKPSLQIPQLKEWSTKSAYIEKTFTNKNADLASRSKIKYNFSEQSWTHAGLLAARTFSVHYQQPSKTATVTFMRVFKQTGTWDEEIFPCLHMQLFYFNLSLLHRWCC